VSRGISVGKNGEARRAGLFQILRTVPARKVNVFSGKEMCWWNSGTSEELSYER